MKAVNVDNHSDENGEEPCHLDEYMFALNGGGRPTVNVTIDSHECLPIIDTGCARDIIEEDMYKRLNTKLQKSYIRLLPY